MALCEQNQVQCPPLQAASWQVCGTAPVHSQQFAPWSSEPNHAARRGRASVTGLAVITIMERTMITVIGHVISVTGRTMITVIEHVITVTGLAATTNTKRAMSTVTGIVITVIGLAVIKVTRLSVITLFGLVVITGFCPQLPLRLRCLSSWITSQRPSQAVATQSRQPGGRRAPSAGRPAACVAPGSPSRGVRVRHARGGGPGRDSKGGQGRREHSLSWTPGPLGPRTWNPPPPGKAATGRR